MANQMIKCRQCGKQISKSEAIEFKSKMYMCSDKCVEAWQIAHVAKQPLNKQANDRTALLDYVKRLDPNANFMVITAQLKRMITDYGMTYAGMRYALWYSVNIANKPYKGVGILPYIYEDAKKYWQWQQRMKQQVADWMPQDDDDVIVRRDVEEDVFI